MFFRKIGPMPPKYHIDGDSAKTQTAGASRWFQALLSIGFVTSGSVLSQEFNTPVADSAFSECSSKAYLTQGWTPSTYELNLVTGDYVVNAAGHNVRNSNAGEELVTSSINALGFNMADYYVYGWSYMHNEPARIHNDWTVEPLTGVNSTDSNFFVGDVSTQSSRYYVYRRGLNYGLYSIGLNPAEEDYLRMRRIVDGETLSLRIADFAFSPLDNLIYALESDGAFRQIDPQTGDSRLLGATGVSGGFGAAYFDAEGTFYASRNSDGNIFRIKVPSGLYEAELFAAGPSSSANDGFRCASAPLVDQTNTNIDFGDAPPSYGTYLADNGARHGLLNNPEIHLGAKVDGESEAYAFPLSDNENKPGDEDGVQFVTSLVERKNAIAMVGASESGYLSVWVDVDQNGTFDSNEHLVVDRLLEPKKQAVYIPIPDGVVAGDTWARFRFSSVTGLAATGGAPDGEVEDYQVTLLSDPYTITSYPSKTGWSTVSYEDNWPFVGDYDMNDLVARLRTQIYRNSDNSIFQITIEGILAAVGADYQNGFAIRLPGVPRDAVDENKIHFNISNRNVGQSPLEKNRQEAILIITENMFEEIRPGNYCNYYRTEPGCGSDPEFSFKISVPFNVAQAVELQGVFDPFLFAAPGEFHGAHFVTPPGRSYEIHMKNFGPTEAFDMSLFAGVGQDTSDPESGHYFLTENGMPWALEIGDEWQYPLEYVDVSAAYPRFTQFARSNGQEFQDWYLLDNAITSMLFQD